MVRPMRGEVPGTAGLGRRVEAVPGALAVRRRRRARPVAGQVPAQLPTQLPTLRAESRCGTRRPGTQGTTGRGRAPAAIAALTIATLALGIIYWIIRRQDEARSEAAARGRDARPD